MKTALFIALGIFALGYLIVWVRHARHAREGVGKPTPLDIERVTQTLAAAVQDARENQRDLSIRWSSAEAQMTRKATRLVREYMRQAWNEV